MTSDYPTRKGYYFRNGKWYPSKRTKKLKAEQKLIREISEQIKLFPDKYQYTKFALTQRSAKYHGFDVYWAKCGKGHLIERKVTDKSCPVCLRISRDIRDKRIREGVIKLSNSEQVRLTEIYQEARSLTESTGVQYHVDHIRPLAAGGAHHPDNLQIIKAEENLAKGALFEGSRKTFSAKEKAAARKEFKVQQGQKEEIAKKKLQEERKKELEEKRKKQAKFNFVIIIVPVVIWILLVMANN